MTIGALISPGLIAVSVARMNPDAFAISTVVVVNLGSGIVQAIGKRTAR
jgi:hypothetical protein